MAARYKTLKVGPADADLDVGPLISERQKSIVSRIHRGGRRSQDGRQAARSWRARLPADITSPQPCSPMSLPRIAWRRRKSSAPSRSSFLSRRGRGDRSRQRDRLRSRRRRLDVRRGPADAARQGAACGQVFLNNYGAGGGVELPFGGVGKSGHGREKGFEALYGFSALKTVAAWHG